MDRDVISVDEKFFVDKISKIILHDVPNFPFEEAEIIRSDSKYFINIICKNDGEKVFIKASHSERKELTFFLEANIDDIKISFNENNDSYNLCVDSDKRFANIWVKTKNRTIRTNNVQYKDLRQSAIGFLLQAFQVYEYINTVKLNEPIIKQSEISKPKQSIKNKKSKTTVINICNTREFKIDGTERKRRKKATVVYSKKAWKCRGHYRHLKNGKVIWIKPCTRRRKIFDDNRSEAEGQKYKVS